MTVNTTSLTLGYDENVTITCTARSKLPFSLDVKWSKNGTVLKQLKSNKNTIILHYTIDKATGSSAGDYMCRAYVFVRNKLMQDNATTTVSGEQVAVARVLQETCARRESRR